MFRNKHAKKSHNKCVIMNIFDAFYVIKYKTIDEWWQTQFSVHSVKSNWHKIYLVASICCQRNFSIIVMFDFSSRFIRLFVAS